MDFLKMDSLMDMADVFLIMEIVLKDIGSILIHNAKERLYILMGEFLKKLKNLIFI
jgi:hypothetical protein